MRHEPHENAQAALADQSRLIAIQREPLRAQGKTLQALAIAQQARVENLTRIVQALAEIAGHDRA